MLVYCPKERRGDDRGTGKKLKSQPGQLERFVYRLATHHRIADVDAWKKRITLRQVEKWLAYWKVEPFGDDWNRTARQTLFILKALGASVDSSFIDVFLPNYDPDRVMTEEEINAELTKFSRLVKG